jgi:hypothetical protein
MGRFAIGISAFGFSSGFAVKVGNEDPGPQRMIAWKPGAGIESAWGIVRLVPPRDRRQFRLSIGSK